MPDSIADILWITGGAAVTVFELVALGYWLTREEPSVIPRARVGQDADGPPAPPAAG